MSRNAGTTEAAVSFAPPAYAIFNISPTALQDQNGLKISFSRWLQLPECSCAFAVAELLCL